LPSARASGRRRGRRGQSGLVGLKPARAMARKQSSARRVSSGRPSQARVGGEARAHRHHRHSRVAVGAECFVLVGVAAVGGSLPSISYRGCRRGKEECWSRPGSGRGFAFAVGTEHEHVARLPSIHVQWRIISRSKSCALTLLFSFPRRAWRCGHRGGGLLGVVAIG
jgi:hypothetical protein